MTSMPETDLWCEVLEPIDFVVDADTNGMYLDALEGHHLRYLRGRHGRPPLVHPGLLLSQSNITKSPTSRIGSDEAHIHAREETEFLSPAHVDTRLHVTWTTADRYEKRGRPYLVTTVLMTDEDGREILRRRMWNTRSTSAMPIPPSAPRREEYTPAVARSSDAFSEVAMPLRGRPRAVTLERMRRFSGWPKKNVHTDEEVARAAGARAPIASAVQHVAHLCDLMLEHFGDGWLQTGALALTFRRAVYPGDVLTWHGIIAGCEDDGRAARYDLEVWCENQDGAAITVGRATGRVD
jgi:acyl dehydratase